MTLSKNERVFLSMLRDVQNAGTDHEARKKAFERLNAEFSSGYQRVLKSDIKRKMERMRDDLALYDEVARMLDYIS